LVLLQRRHRQTGVAELLPVELGGLALASPDDRLAAVVDSIGDLVTPVEGDTRDYAGKRARHMIERVVVVVEHDHAPRAAPAAPWLSHTWSFDSLRSHPLSSGLPHRSPFSPVTSEAKPRLIRRRSLPVGDRSFRVARALDPRHGLGNERLQSRLFSALAILLQHGFGLPRLNHEGFEDPVEMPVRFFHRTEMSQRQPPWTDCAYELQRPSPELDVDVRRGRRREDQLARRNAYPRDVAHIGSPIFGVEVDDVMRGVARSVGDLELAVT